MVPSSQLLSRCTAPKNTAIPNLPHPSDNSCFSAQLSLQVKLLSKTRPGFAARVALFRVPRAGTLPGCHLELMAKSLLTPLGWSFVTEHPPAPALGKAEEKTFPAELSVQQPGFVMCHHTKQTKKSPSPRASLPSKCLPSIFCL